MVQPGQLSRPEASSIATEPGLRQGREVVAVDRAVTVEAVRWPDRHLGGQPADRAGDRGDGDRGQQRDQLFARDDRGRSAPADGQLGVVDVTAVHDRRSSSVSTSPSACAAASEKADSEAVCGWSAYALRKPATSACSRRALMTSASALATYSLRLRCCTWRSSSTKARTSGGRLMVTRCVRILLLILQVCSKVRRLSPGRYASRSGAAALRPQE